MATADAVNGSAASRGIRHRLAEPGSPSASGMPHSDIRFPAISRTTRRPRNRSSRCRPRTR
jgi:hypothetical protein